MFHASQKLHASFFTWNPRNGSPLLESACSRVIVDQWRASVTAPSYSTSVHMNFEIALPWLSIIPLLPHPYRFHCISFSSPKSQAKTLLVTDVPKRAYQRSPPPILSSTLGKRAALRVVSYGWARLELSRHMYTPRSENEAKRQGFLLRPKASSYYSLSTTLVSTFPHEILPTYSPPPQDEDVLAQVVALGC